MKCQTYIFQLTSGQLDSAGWVQRLQAKQHSIICRHCRAFTRNDAQLTHIVRDFQDHLTALPAPDTSTSDDASSS